MNFQKRSNKGNVQVAESLYSRNSPQLLPYILNFYPSSEYSPFAPGAVCQPDQEDPGGETATRIAQDALVLWNQYLESSAEGYRSAFLRQVYWLIEHEVQLPAGAGGWPVTFPHPYVYLGGSWLSARTQGLALSVFVRAYMLTSEESYLQIARCIFRTFELDILDGGVCSPVGEDGVFFEEVAAYPAAHILSGCIYALFGLYDYAALTADAGVQNCITRCLTTMHVLLDEFDVGYWTRADLLRRKLASPSELILQAALLQKLAVQSGCSHCSRIALRWQQYSRSPLSRLRYAMKHGYSSVSHILLSHVRSRLFARSSSSPTLRVCIPITAFPITGGMRTVLGKIAHVTSDMWNVEYLTRHIGPTKGNLVIHRFGTGRTVSWQFPSVWLYCMAGAWKLFTLLRRGSAYDIILPQDGIYTGTFAAFIGKLAGIRVVCVDHGNLVSLASPLYRTEHQRTKAARSWIQRALENLRFQCYWPSLRVLAWIAGHLIDHFYIPGVAGDGVEEVCRSFGVGPHRITRFVNMIELERHVLLDAESKRASREANTIPIDAVIITTICRLAPEKGVDILVEGISHALAALDADLRASVRCIIAGDGPMRPHIEEKIREHKLDQVCIFWGEIAPERVLLLQSVSDIYVYAGTRGGGYSLAILEAMASGCAVIATDVPFANECMLAEGRGIIVPAGNALALGSALVRLITEQELRSRMGRLARNYVEQHNTIEIFKRVWMRATYWSDLDGLLAGKKEE